MARRPCATANLEQMRALKELARSERRDEADRARGMLLSLEGWTSEAIGTAFGVTANSVRHGAIGTRPEACRAFGRRWFRGRPASAGFARCRLPRRSCPSRWGTARTGRSLGSRPKSSGGVARRSRSLGSASCRGKKGVLLAAASPQPDGPAGRRRSDRAQAGVAQGPGRDGRHYPSLCRRSSDNHDQYELDRIEDEGERKRSGKSYRPP